MSLINEALKKAQQDRSGSPGPSVPGQPSYPQGEPGGAGRGLFVKMIISAAAAAALVAGGVVLAVFMYMGRSGVRQAPEADVNIPAAGPEPAVAADDRTLAAGPPPPLPAGQSTPAAVAPAPETTPASEPPSIGAAPARKEPPPAAGAHLAHEAPLQKTAAALETPAEEPAYEEPDFVIPKTEPAPEKSGGPPAKAAPDKAIIRFLSRLKVLGVKKDNTKILLESGIYKVNDLVNYKPKIILRQIGQQALLFVDAHGVTYKKELDL